MAVMVVRVLRGGLLPLIFIFLMVGSVSCDIRKEKEDKVVIQDFFTNLNKGEYQKAIEETDSEAKQLMEHLLNNFPPDILNLVFPNLFLVSVEYDELLTKGKKDIRVYRVKYTLKVDENIKNNELKNILKDSEKGEALFYLKKGKIQKIIDIQGNVFVK